MPQNGRGIRIFAEGLGVAIGQNFHHPIVEIIHRMVLNRAKTAVVFLACFINVHPQADADVFVLTAEANFLRLQKFDVLHGYFGHAVRATVQFLLFPGKIGKFKSLFGDFRFRRWRSLQDRRHFGSCVQHFFRLFHPFQLRFGRRLHGDRNRGCWRSLAR